jgi:serine phosphatase RsbU (regulator of sigma subunit)
VLDVRPSRTVGRWLIIAVLQLAVFVALRFSDEPGFAFSMYALVPILLAVAWFDLAGGLVMAGLATLLFLIDGALTQHAPLVGAGLALATFNRATVFFGIAALVSALLRRERGLAARVREQQAELDELESLRAALTPRAVPTRPQLEFATAFVPAEGAVAGDFFLVTEGPRGSTTIVVGDVVGHDLGSARRAAFARAALATYARFTAHPAELLRLANTSLLESGDGGAQFVTAVCVTIDAAPENELCWAAAGHPPPWFLDSAEPLPGGRVGTPLGVGADTFTVEEGRTVLAPGAGVLLFTDGLTEGRRARRPRRERLDLFGEERARRIVLDQRGAPAVQVLDALVAGVTGFARGPLADDLCLVAVRAAGG